MADRLGLRLSEPFLHGMLLAANAIPDAFLLVDGPGCVTAKARRITGPHDLCSSLLDCASEGRVRYSGIDVYKISSNYEDDLVRQLCALGREAACGLVLLSALPMCIVAGTDYGRLVASARAQVSTPIFECRRRSLADDWLGGYAATLAAMAKGMDLGDRRAEQHKVAVVGYLMDRNEGEHRGNVAALEQMLRSLQLDPVAIWLSGEPFEQLREARHAQIIIALPHGREAARILAERLGAQLVEAGLPFGLNATREWLAEVAAATGREPEADAFIQRELDRVIPRLEWVVPQIFVNRTFAYVGDPHYGRCFVELIRELGGTVTAAVMTADQTHLSDDEHRALSERTAVQYQPDVLELCELWQRLDREGLDLLVANSFAAEVVEVSSPWLEWGYPSHYTHYLADEPFLGFGGCLGFVSRLANALSQQSAAFRAR